MAHVIVEIDGTRHKMVKTRVGGDLCKRCSLLTSCGIVIDHPCAGVNTYFKHDIKGSINKKGDGV